jgi:uncharacterized iron-regulated protein
VTRRKLFQLCTWFLSIIFLFLLSNYLIQKANSLNETKQFDRSQIINELNKANIVYLGEVHDSQKDHQAQLEIIQTLHDRDPKIAIAFEMFQRQFQPVFNEYIAGKINESQLKKQSEYEERWGFNWEYYAPILQFAKQNSLSLLALNTPTEITIKVSTEGLKSLTPEEKKQIPPFSEIRTDNQDYRQMLAEVFQQHTHGKHGNSKDIENFFTTQVLWDETMAEAIAQYHQKNPSDRIIVLAGQGHIIYGFGIPDRVARRMQGKTLIQRSVFMSNYEDLKSKKGKPPADYFWNLR